MISSTYAMGSSGKNELREYLDEFRSADMETSVETNEDDTIIEEGEEEWDWLKRTGYDFLVCDDEPSPDCQEIEWEALHTLSQRQAAVVKRRVMTLRDTMRRKRTRERPPKLDVRQVFANSTHSPTTPTEPGEETAVSPACSDRRSSEEDTCGVGHLTTSGSDVDNSHSRSATPDSLDSISPLLQPVAVKLNSTELVVTSPGSDDVISERHRFVSGSPNSQGYHSCSRSSLEQITLDDPGNKQDYRHVLRIPLDCSDDCTLSERCNREASNHHLHHHHHRHHRLRSDRSPTPIRLRTSSSPLDTSTDGALTFQPVHALRSIVGQKLTSPTTSPVHIPRVRYHASPADITSGLAISVPTRYSNGLSLLLFDTEIASEQRLGSTQIEDLSDADARRVQKLALLELTGLFDEHSISYRCRKARRQPRNRARNSTGGDAAMTVFGIELSSLLEQDRAKTPSVGGMTNDKTSLPPSFGVPLLFEHIVSHLEQYGVSEEGVLRIPANSQKVEALKRQCDSDFYSNPTSIVKLLSSSTINEVASLLKHFLRQLPTPLFTNELMYAFTAVQKLPELPMQLQALNLLCVQLPAVNRAVLRRLLSLMADIASHEHKNRMSLENVAVIIAPNLIFPPSNVRRQKDINAEVAFASVTSAVVKTLAENRDQIWTVPILFVRQIRQQHEEEHYQRVRKQNNKTSKMRLLRRRRDTAVVLRKIVNEVDFQDGVIRVSAAQFNKVACPILLTSSTTAADVVARCSQEAVLLSDLSHKLLTRHDVSLGDSGSSRRVPMCPRACSASNVAAVLLNHFLFEEGGNIDRRRLDHSALVLDCYQENPNARWVIYCCHD